MKSSNGTWLTARIAVGLPVAALALGLFTSAPATAAPPDPVTSAKDSPLTPGLQDLAAGAGPSRGPGLRPGSLDDRDGIVTKANGRVLVDVRVATVSADSLAALRAAGARVHFVDEQLRTVTVAVSPDNLDALAALSPLVESVQEILTPMTNAACPSGDFVSEGVTQLKAALARSNFSVTGRDLTVGVMSDSYNVLGGANADVANGELPGATNPCGNPEPVGTLLEGLGSSTDEGRAMAQIVHDVAPGAKILFASALGGENQFAQSIRDLAAQGADIIVDDVTYYSEPVYQDGVVAKAVADVTAQGVVYFSSAANSNYILGGNRVASYESPTFRPTTCPTAIVTRYAPRAVTCHNFSTVGTDALYDLSLSGTGSRARYSLGWNEPQFGIATDLDLCAVTTSGAGFIACSADDSFTTQKAFELVNLTGPGSGALVVVRYAGSGTPRLKMISHRSDLGSVQFNTSVGGDIVGPTIFGHNASIPGVTVAAIRYNTTVSLEDFSSWGPAMYCYGPVVGDVPAAALSPCQSATVDMTATDGGQNSFFGGGSPHRFYGTSAAAPHAAAVAALLLDKEPCLTPAQVIGYLKSTGRAVGTTGVDGAGSGLIDATAALTAGNGANCDTSAPKIDIGVNGWYRTATVSGIVTGADHRLVTALSCTGVPATAVTGLNTPSATGTLTVTGEGQHPISCTGTDVEGNTGAAPGSTNTVTVGIDTGPPAVVCRPATFRAGQPGIVTADVSDGVSGPVAPTLSVAVPTASGGTFTVALTGADRAGNSASSACAFSVVQIAGPGKVRVGSSKKYRALGFPASSKVKWTLKRKGSTVDRARMRSNAAGESKVKVRFPRKGKYVLSAKSGAVKASKSVRAR